MESSTLSAYSDALELGSVFFGIVAVICGTTRSNHMVDETVVTPPNSKPIEKARYWIKRRTYFYYVFTISTVLSVACSFFGKKIDAALAAQINTDTKNDYGKKFDNFGASLGRALGEYSLGIKLHYDTATGKLTTQISKLENEVGKKALGPDRYLSPPIIKPDLFMPISLNTLSEDSTMLTLKLSNYGDEEAINIDFKAYFLKKRDDNIYMTFNSPIQISAGLSILPTAFKTFDTYIVNPSFEFNAPNNFILFSIRYESKQKIIDSIKISYTYDAFHKSWREYSGKINLFESLNKAQYFETNTPFKIRYKYKIQ